MIVNAECWWNVTDRGQSKYCHCYFLHILIIFDKSNLPCYVSQLRKWCESPAGKVLAYNVRVAGGRGGDMAEIVGFFFGF